MAKKVMKAARIGVKQNTRFGFYPSYQFKDHDPILDQIDRLHELTARSSGTDKPLKFATLSHRSGVSVATLHNWRIRKTKKPQFATVKAVVAAMGGELTVIYNGQEIKPGGRHANVIPITRGLTNRKPPSRGRRT